MLFLQSLPLDHYQYQNVMFTNWVEYDMIILEILVHCLIVHRSLSLNISYLTLEESYICI